jgi:hypothetical protein
MWNRIIRTHLAGVAALVASHGGLIGSVAAERTAQDGIGVHAPVLPIRRAPDALPAALPALPASAERVVPLTFELTVQLKPGAGRGQSVQQTVSRTADRVHVAVRNGREWLFERNPRDPRRVSGFLVDHTSRSIVAYQESDLRMMHGIRGWADVLALGFDMDRLRTFKRQRDTRSVGAIRFGRYTSGKGAKAEEVWWSDEQLMPLRFTTTDSHGSSQLSVGRLRREADVKLLRPPDARFPTYRVFDLANWLERH